MMMSATAETNTTKDPYGPSDRAYAAVKKVSKLDDLRTGEKILFTPLMKSFYFHIWRFQNNGGHGWVWDNQDYIAWELGTTKPALGRAINSLAAAGVVEIKEKERGSLKSYAYQVVNPKRIVEMGFTPPAPSRTAGMFKVDEFKATNEGSKNDGKSKSEEEHPAAVEPSTLGNDEQHGLQLTADNRGDDVSPNDAVNEELDPVFPVPKAEQPQEAPPREDIQVYKSWREEGSSGFGFMEYGVLHGETDVERITVLIDQHYFEAFSQIVIFDENGVVREEFINALSGCEAPKRNDDGTLQNYCYAYAKAKTTQAYRDGKASPEEINNSWGIWMSAAQLWHVPMHLLPKSEPELKSEPEFEDAIPY